MTSPPAPAPEDADGLQQADAADLDRASPDAPSWPPGVGTVWSRSQAVDLWHRLRWRWGGSLLLRVLMVTVVVGVAAIALISVYLSARVQDALYEQRVEEALADALTRSDQIQQQFDASTATTPAQVQEVAVQILRAAQSPGSGAISTMTRSSGASASGAITLNVGTPVPLTNELRNAVQDSGTQQWQAVEVITPDGVGPGIVVGSVLTPPEVGPHELYFVYSLIPEQETLTLIQQTLTLAGFALFALLGAMAWYLTRQVLGPVQQAAPNRRATRYRASGTAHDGSRPR